MLQIDPNQREAIDEDKPVPSMSVSEAADHVDGLLRFHRGLDKLSQILHLAVDIEAETMHKQAQLEEVNTRLAESLATQKMVQKQLAADQQRLDQMRTHVERMKAQIGAI